MIILSVHFDDTDMKIVGEQHIHSHYDHFDALDFIRESKQQRFNGNTAKAKALGSNIVSAFSYKAAPEELYNMAKEMGIEIDAQILLQIKILSVFSAEYCLNNYLPSPMLSTVAIGELYDVLMEISADFYEELSRSTAFSLYYMCAKENDSCMRKVGEQFAMLCGKKDEENYIQFGINQHKLNTEVYKKAIQGFAFV